LSRSLSVGLRLLPITRPIGLVDHSLHKPALSNGSGWHTSSHEVFSKQLERRLLQEVIAKQSGSQSDDAHECGKQGSVNDTYPTEILK
jgi:hypothetical protein